MHADLPVLSSKRLCLEIALYLEGSGDTVEDILQRNQITPEQLNILLSNPIFRADLMRQREEIRDKGLTFRIKARTMAEELLRTTWDITQDTSSSAAVRADMIKAVVQWGDLVPKNKDTGTGDTGGVRIMINLGPNETKQLDITPSPSLLPA